MVQALVAQKLVNVNCSWIYNQPVRTLLATADDNGRRFSHHFGEGFRGRDKVVDGRRGEWVSAMYLTQKLTVREPMFHYLFLPEDHQHSTGKKWGQRESGQPDLKSPEPLLNGGGK